MKQKLRGLINAGRSKEELSLLPFVNDRTSAAPGRWTAKDHLAHLAAWRAFAAEEVVAVRTGTRPRPVSDDLDFENARIYEETHGLPAGAILQAGAESWRDLLAAVEASTEAELFREGVRRPAQRLWQVVQVNSTTHLAGHLGFWYDEHGDRAAAERSAKWAYGLAIATFSDDPARGAAAYNLGCFYALRGEAGEAVRYLRQGIDLRPDLHDLAGHDTDLDLIRPSSEFQALIRRPGAA